MGLDRYCFLVVLLSILTACGGGGGESSTPEANPPVNSGLDARPSNTTCLAPTRPGSSSNIRLERAYPNLVFNQPVGLYQEPNDSSRWYVIEKGGRIIWFDANDENTVTKNTYLNYGSVVDARSEGGLLGMAFHPDFPTNKDVFLSYTINAAGDPSNEMVSLITRMTENADGDALDPSTEGIILQQNQFETNHNGGNIAFGPDGYLYIGFGDGGGGGDPRENGQDTSTLLGAILRLDVDSASPYSIPPDNPFASGGGRPEIYAYGLRNPWRWSFDTATGELWLGDVGQSSFEEINLIVNGGNFGWDCYEANTPYELTGCPTASQLIFPVAEYGRTDGVSVTGGYVYRGNMIPALQGVYLFGDFGFGTIWGLFPQSGNTYSRQVMADAGFSISSFGQANDGELYIVDYGGRLFRILSGNPGGQAGGPATMLSDTGCVDPSNPVLPAAGMIPYTVNESFWSDGADKTRYLALPDSTTMTETAGGDFDLPNNSVLMKHFSLGGQIFETRLLVRHDDGGWAGYTYEWNTSLTDANLVDATGKDKTVNGLAWHYPSRTECLQCHTTAAGFSLGVEGLQLNGDFTYPATGRTANQLDTLQHIGIFSAPLSAAATVASLTDSRDQSTMLDARARSYLHSNCANCHRPGGTTQSTMDLRFSTALDRMNICNVDPQQGYLGINQAKLLAPGDPARSILLERISRNDQTRMPPVGSNTLDGEAITLLTDWISSIQACP